MHYIFSHFFFVAFSSCSIENSSELKGFSSTLNPNNLHTPDKVNIFGTFSNLRNESFCL